MIFCNSNASEFQKAYCETQARDNTGTSTSLTQFSNYHLQYIMVYTVHARRLDTSEIMRKADITMCDFFFTFGVSNVTQFVEKNLTSTFLTELAFR